MTLEQRIKDFIVDAGTDYKTFRSFMTGGTSGTFALATTSQNIKGAIAELQASVQAAAAGMPANATEAAVGVGEIATTAEVTAGTDDFRWVTPLKLAAKLTAWAQPLSANLTSLSGQSSTVYGRGLLALADAAALTAQLPIASDTVVGVSRNATQAEVNTGTLDTAAVTPLKFQTRLAAYAQPVNANLTNLAGVTNTAYGRGFLALAAQANLLAMFPAASETTASLIEIATQTETNTGTDDARAVTPLKLQTRLAAYAMPLAYLDTDVLLAANSDTKIATQKATKAYADSLLDANNAYQYKGAIDASTNPNYPAASAGHTYRVSVAGKIGGASGVNVEQGDTLTALQDGLASGTQAAVGTNWLITQTNIDGAVVGPTSSVASNVPMFSGTTGKVIADSGVSFSTDGTMVANSDAKAPTEKAVRTFAAANYASLAAIGNPDPDLVAAYAAAKA
jgi:hypothetical protein